MQDPQLAVALVATHRSAQPDRYRHHNLPHRRGVPGSRQRGSPRESNPSPCLPVHAVVVLHPANHLRCGHQAIQPAALLSHCSRIPLPRRGDNHRLPERLRSLLMPQMSCGAQPAVGHHNSVRTRFFLDYLLSAETETEK